ncbi:hypothetical protein TEA_006630 [Camellia sinensis var. sinensis]|uniref:DUF7356 domain-containing protein n=1 Tax=Camellia sinensis var. sinensis TaxID=542762 RepID=A0A4S4EWN4_CAMSN|nr:hypothetical protein TEA_006630 [Camellia sinensis var. sinensis]
MISFPQISPLPNPVSESKANPIDGGKPGKEQLDDDKNTKGSVNDANNKASANPPPAAWIDDDKNHGEKDGKTSSQSGGNRTCEGSDNRCDVNGTMIACIPSLESGSKDLVLLVQNKGESTLKVNINITTPAKNDPISREISKHQTKMYAIAFISPLWTYKGEKNWIIRNMVKMDNAVEERLLGYEARRQGGRRGVDRRGEIGLNNYESRSMKTHDLREGEGKTLGMGNVGICRKGPGRYLICELQLRGFEKDAMKLIVTVGAKMRPRTGVNCARSEGSKLKIGRDIKNLVNISWTIGQNTKIVLKYANETCVLHNGTPPSEWNNFLQRLPSYYKQVTPIYVAYFLFLIALIVGGSWACYKFRKRKRHEGVPYRELEMGLPDSASASNVDTAEGWDEVWDDDWDEDKAVKSPGGRHVGNISANGLTARSTSREGWEKDWDD